MKTSLLPSSLGLTVCRMSGSGRSLLLLLQRCVTGRQTRLFSGIQAGGSWSSHQYGHLLQQQTRTTWYRRRSCQPLQLLKPNHLGLCTKVNLSCYCTLALSIHSASKRSHELTASVVAGRSTMGGWVSAPASLPLRTRQEGGLHCAGERSAMVLLCWGSLELLLRWAKKIETHINCGRTHQNTGKLKEWYDLITVICSCPYVSASLRGNNLRQKWHRNNGTFFVI